MTSSITFEVAALADVIKQAAKVAPSKGMAFDKAAGIIIEFNPAGAPLAVVRATNLEIFSMEWVNVSEMTGDPAVWRFPSLLLASVVGSLPIGTGKTVTLTSEPGEHRQMVHLKAGKVKVKFHLIGDEEFYPRWSAFDPDAMYPANDLGGRIDQVEWAASSSDPKMQGVYLDGTYAVATDSFRLACVPLPIPGLERPIVLPAGILGQILKQTGEIQIGVDSMMLNLMPDQYRQIKSVVFDVKYPNVSKIMEREFDTEIKINRDVFLETLSRVNSFALGDRTAAFRIFFGKEEINVYMMNDQVGVIRDDLEVPGFATHDRFEMKFTPKNIMDGLSKSPNKDLVLSYNQGDPRSVLKIDDGAGYRAWIMPRINTTSGENQ